MKCPPIRTPPELDDLQAIAGLHLAGIEKKVKEAFLAAHKSKLESRAGTPPKYFPHRRLSSCANRDNKAVGQELDGDGGLSMHDAAFWKMVRSRSRRRRRRRHRC